MDDRASIVKMVDLRGFSMDREQILGKDCKLYQGSFSSENRLLRTMHWDRIAMNG